MPVQASETKPIRWRFGHEVPRELFKYWSQRLNLFSRFEDGVKMDLESWYSVTPESIAKHIANRIFKSLGQPFLILDPFCGVGGNLIQFALQSTSVRVIGCDINEDRVNMAKHNAKIYGVLHRCDFIVGDFYDIVGTLSHLPIDAVFLSPPWGGYDYIKMKKYSLNSMSPNGFEVIRLCRKYLTSNIAILMPRNVDLVELRKTLNKEFPLIEYEKNLVGNKTKTMTAYFGQLADNAAETDNSDSESTKEAEEEASDSKYLSTVSTINNQDPTNDKQAPTTEKQPSTTEPDQDRKRNKLDLDEEPIRETSKPKIEVSRDLFRVSWM